MLHSTGTVGSQVAKSLLLGAGSNSGTNGSSNHAPYEQPWSLKDVGPTGELIYENPNAYPRAYMARKAILGNEQQALSALTDVQSDLRECSVFEAPDGRVVPEPPQANGKANVLEDGDERVLLESESLTGGLLLLADTMAPGWKVTIDDQPATAVTANYLFRGVIVPAGTHRVCWTYAAPGLKTGACTSLLTAMMLGFLFAGWPQSLLRRRDAAAR
jgi:hypothetical protein